MITFFSLLLQVATLGLVAYLLVQFKALFREVRTPVVRHKGQMPADFRDRLRNLPRPNGEAPKERTENREGRDRNDRGDRTENRGDRNREGRDRNENRGDRNREGRDRNENRGDRTENRGDRNREGRDRNENRGDRNREGRDRNDRGPRPPRTEDAPVVESVAPVATESVAPVATSAPSFGGRRPLGPVHSSAEAPAVESSSSSDALAPASLAQPVTSDAPIRHGRRTLPKAKPRFDDEPETTTEA